VNVLFVTEKFPYPLDNGGNVRTFHLLKGLAREHQVTLVAADPGDVRKSDVEAVNGLCRDVRLVRVPRLTTARDVLHLLGSFASGVPFLLSRHVYAAVRAEIETLFGQGAQAFDVVHFNHLDSALYRDVVPPGVMQVLDQHNIVTNQVKTSLGAETSPARRVILRKELRKLLRFEPELCRQMDACLVCSEADAQALQNLGVKQTPAVIPNGVDLEYFEMAPLPRERRNTIAFLGGVVLLHGDSSAHPP
jgi:glycosyltransferase involved in cell wall biosynthesis